LDLGGPGVIVNDTCGFVIKTTGYGQEEIVGKIADAAMILSQDLQVRKTLAQGAIDRAKEFNWTALVDRIYGGDIRI